MPKLAVWTVDDIYLSSHGPKPWLPSGESRCFTQPLPLGPSCLPLGNLHTVSVSTQLQGLLERTLLHKLSSQHRVTLKSQKWGQTVGLLR